MDDSAASRRYTTSAQTRTNTITYKGHHNGISEVQTPGQAESDSKCTDVTSYDHDWYDDVLCTRPDGSQFYTNYAGGQAADSTFGAIMSRW
jgi:hypothetical protein